MPRFTDAVRWSAIALVLPALCSCSEYLDRRDTISVYGGDAPLGNRVVQMVDPWPPYAADRDVAYDGVVMRSAVERYRTGRVIQPRGIGTSSTYDSGQNSPPPADGALPGGAVAGAAAAATK